MGSSSSGSSSSGGNYASPTPQGTVTPYGQATPFAPSFQSFLPSDPGAMATGLTPEMFQAAAPAQAAQASPAAAVQRGSVSDPAALANALQQMARARVSTDQMTGLGFNMRDILAAQQAVGPRRSDRPEPRVSYR